MEQPLEQQKLSYCPVAWQAQQNPKLIAIRTDDKQLTFTDLHHHITHLTAQLVNLKMKKGDRLVSIAKNGLPLLLLQLACLRNGFIFSPINPKFSQREIEQRLTLLNSSFIWQPNRANSLQLEFNCHSSVPLHEAEITIDPLAIINIIFTSGSSGTPKAVMHHFSNHYYSALGSQTVIPLTVGDSNLLSLPMFHISGYATVIRTLLAGATLHISTQKITIKQLQKHKITHLSLVSNQLQQLLQNTQFLSHSLAIKHLLLGGSAFSSKILAETRKRGFTYHLSYGSTEMASQIATSTNDQALQLLPYRQLKVIDDEIQVAGETRFAGYFNGDSHSGLIKKNSYFASSDIGELNGKTIKILGRKDRQFISGGENIQPEEIEKLLLTFPMLSQVYILPINDAEYGLRPIAFIQWHREAQLEQLKLFIKDKLVTFKQPLHYFPLPLSLGIKPNPQKLMALALPLLQKT